MQDLSPLPTVHDGIDLGWHAPDFLMIGAMKAATSTVSAYLEGHPDIFMVAGQDPNYFGDDQQWARGPFWYGGLFADAGPGQLRGEGTNNYASDSLFPAAADRIARACPNTKLIYIVREPVSRIISHWIQVRADRPELAPPTLSAAVTKMPERFVAPSLYWRQISRYRAHFPDSQIWIGFMEEMTRDPDAFFADLCRFLGVATHPHDGSRRNPSTGKRLPGPLYTRIRQLPGARQLAACLPSGLKQHLRKALMSRPLSKRPRFAPEVLAYLTSRLRDDSARFLAHCGRPKAIWNLQ